MMLFGTWLEQDEKSKLFIFCDLDETLVHCPKKMPTNLDGKKVHAKGDDYFVLPRPGAKDFLEDISKFSQVYILSHNTEEYVKAIIKALDWNKYIKDCITTRTCSTGELEKKFILTNKKWILIDNLHVSNVKTANKMRILGLKEIAQANDHFVKIKNWAPTANKYDDCELQKILPKIKQKLRIE
jgi:TFIIF-interacting CTD phosphatase-like protein